MNPYEDPETLLSDLLVEFATVAGRPGGRLNRYHARDTLIALGQLVLAREEEEEAASARWVEPLREALAPFGDGFEQAAREELGAAVDEYVRSVDPRFLEHPRYDFAYTVLARERLEARLVAAGLLGIVPEEAQLERVAAADLILEPYLGGFDPAR
jgi:hypothetical protein